MLEDSSIIPFSRVRQSETVPLVIFLDMQAEFVSEGRLLHIRNAAPVLTNARHLLEHARRGYLSVAHCRSWHHGTYFNRDSPHSSWIEEFRPNGSEMVFERDKPSGYASRSFSRMMDAGGGRNALIVGFMGSTSCLATLIDAHRREHHVKFVHDASASVSSGGLSERQAHRAAVHVASHFSEIVTTREILTSAGQEYRHE